MSIRTVQQLELYGPDRCETMSTDQARAMCLRLARGRYENFSVLSALVPCDLRPDFAALYAFCRWADDLGDEIGSTQRSLELLAWWRRELQQCFEGHPRHPVFLALHPTIQKHNLPIEPFDNLIEAFEQDQTVTRYQTWDQLIGYCRRSADPVGRLVLMICGEERSEKVFHLSNCLCTALQLTNHWQDVRRDVLDRNRIYIPQELHRIADFEERLIGSAKQGYAVDREFLGEARLLIRHCVERTWLLFEQGSELFENISPRTQPIIRLLASGGRRVLHLIEMWNYETILHRPVLSKQSKLWLIVKAWWSARRTNRKAIHQ